MPVPDSLSVVQQISYPELKTKIAKTRLALAKKYSTTRNNRVEILKQANDFWVSSVGTDMFAHWKNTAWDFNGTSTVPGEGSIACGFFVTTLLQDMDLNINRRKLAICTSSEMMKSLVPHQPLLNLSNLSYAGFANTMQNAGKGVYIIGLDFHTGFILHDGADTWFIHSNYINRKGVVKELLENSAALQASKTKWVVSISTDRIFIERWLKI
ncbi:MAG: hypothetical protein J0L56_07305 [Chitinophagales bacterium]|nr:hypothetical protein [Chitinophagales bacterium]